MSNFTEVIKTSRPISWVNTAYPFAAGYLVASGGISVFWFVTTIYFLIPYNLLMYGINDVFDYESDLLNPRKGGVEGAVTARSVHRTIVWSALLSGLPFLVYMVWQTSMVANLFLVFILFMVIAYSAPILRFKERPFLDSITSSTHFVGPLVYGLLVVGWQTSFLPYVVAFFLWGMASHAFGAVQDITADRKGKIASIGTVLGAAWTTRFALILYITAVGLLVGQGLVVLPVAVCGLLYAANIAPFANLHDKQCEIANAGWRRFLWLNYLTGAVITITLILTV